MGRSWKWREGGLIQQQEAYFGGSWRCALHNSSLKRTSFSLFSSKDEKGSWCRNNAPGRSTISVITTFKIYLCECKRVLRTPNHDTLVRMKSITPPLRSIYIKCTGESTVELAARVVSTEVERIEGDQWAILIHVRCNTHCLSASAPRARSAPTMTFAPFRQPPIQLPSTRALHHGRDDQEGVTEGNSWFRL